jgi:hypothetical protein
MLKRHRVKMVINLNPPAACKRRLTQAARVFAAGLLLLWSPLHATATVLWGG